MYDHKLIRKIMDTYGITSRMIERRTSMTKTQVNRIAKGMVKNNPKGVLQIVEVFLKKGIEEASQIISEEYLSEYKKRNKYYNECNFKIYKKEKNMLDKKILDFFKLKGNPFLAGRVNKVWQNENFKKFSDTLIHAALNDRFLLCTGPTGTGKSTLVSHVTSYLEKETNLMLISPCSLEPEDINSSFLMNEMIETLGNQRIPREKRRRQKVLQNVLSQMKKRNQKVCMLIDEAHRLPARTLRTLKQFWEGLGVHYGSMSIILIAQPMIEGTLSLYNLKEVNDRLEAVRLTPFSLNGKISYDEVKAYIEFKIKSCKGKNMFRDDAIHAMIPRVDTPQEVNNICCRAIKAAAYIGESEITKNIIETI